MNKKTNILFIVTDDQRFDMLNCYPNSKVKTPNMDMLARRGVHFTNAHIPGGNTGAVCQPSRAMLNCGRTLQHILNRGENIPPEHITLPEYLRQNNYTTYAVGKWHNGKESFARSFDNGRTLFFGGMWDHWNVPCYNFHNDGNYSNTIPYCPDWKYSNQVVQRDADFIAAGVHSSELFSNQAIELLEDHDDNQSFYMYLAYLAPHDPRTMPPEFKAQYPISEVELPANFCEEYPFDYGAMSSRDEHLSEYPRNREELKNHISDYYAMITHLDYHIGRVIDYLKRKNLYDNTIIILAGDNGLSVGQHAFMGKQSLYEHSIRVPLLISGPEILSNKRSDSQVYLCDVFPSICEHLNLEIPSSVNSQSFAKELVSSEHVSREELFLSYCQQIRGIKTANYKYILYAGDNGDIYQELFNLEDDPDELENLAEKESTLVQKFRDRLYELAIENGDLKVSWGQEFWERIGR